ncbi:hypothetical protein J8L88_20630 [Aquimarina sp. MMG015]|uniref:hypothetical protein n=1 Tax=Aquimarina TaxID=290174 RepID=UPI00041F1740|nr:MULTISPECIES: hypothetical protein [Aquimarina]AXT55839.1 hypothetical protein D1815_08780 [Aquimarina sp. AD1]MBQ4805279.1 hypothetical protein [Aquimarina sp. MMG015]RKN29735.1 hypothetical protein D7035_06795 [Aquimarina sp. AD1]
MEADITQIIIQLFIGLAYAIPTLFFIIISIYYLLKMGSQIDGILILAGNVIIFLCIVIGRILFIQFAFYQKWEGTIYSYITTAISIVSVIGSILFAVGVFLLMKKVIKAKSLTS